ncbi:unnamed protein product [Fraxinus pennsylvanica]|uniref:Uncharacterized protein n=1 Tax=Fraxinus pennsylvanica TaxID=56036 RepID=A0AAD2E4Y8_9LAMI|nr:unnamed protein product [Fraxinus pennsylvanica]
MSVVGALLFGVGCGVLTTATMYFLWSLFSPHRFDFDDDDDITSSKKMGYLAIPTNPKDNLFLQTISSALFLHYKAMASECNKSFCRDYMLLKPEEAGLVDVFRILFSDDIGKRKFIDCPDGKQPAPFKRRWLIFVSILVQKLLLAVEKPMAWFGSLVEQWLNLLSSNGSLSSLMLNFLRGNVIYTEKTAANFLSFIGHVDNRRKLDDKIKLGDKRYYAALSMMAAKVSYENKANIEFTVMDYWKIIKGKLQHKRSCSMTKMIKSSSLSEAPKPSMQMLGLPTSISLGLGKVHGGFMQALGLQKNEGWPREQAADKKQEVAYYAIRKILKTLL